MDSPMNMFSTLLTFAKPGIYLLFILLAVVLPAFLRICHIIRLLHQKRIWLDVEPNVLQLTQGNLADYPDPSGYVLRSVLTDQPGVANSAAIAPALDYLAFQLESPLRFLRSLSYLSVLIGLLGMVALLAFHFSKGKPDLSILQIIYPINAIAIFFAVIVFISFLLLRLKADDFIAKASRILGILGVEKAADGLDPQLVRALDAVAERFKDWGQEVNQVHLEQTRGLIREMQNVGDAIRQMVGDLIAARQEEDKGLLPVLVGLEARTETMSERLDHGFKLLAQPFERGIPILEKLENTVERLDAGVVQLLAADPKGALEEVGRQAQAMALAVSSLPLEIKGSLDGASRAMAQATREAIKGSVDEVRAVWGEEIVVVLHNLASTAEGLSAFLGELPQVLATNLQDMGLSVSAATGQAVSQNLDPLLRTGIETLKTIVEEQAQVCQGMLAATSGLPQAMQENLHNLTNALVTSIQDANMGLDRLGLQIMEEIRKGPGGKIEPRIQELGGQLIKVNDHLAQLNAKAEFWLDRVAPGGPPPVSAARDRGLSYTIPAGSSPEKKPPRSSIAPGTPPLAGSPTSKTTVAKPPAISSRGPVAKPASSATDPENPKIPMGWDKLESIHHTPPPDQAPGRAAEPEEIYQTSSGEPKEPFPASEKPSWWRKLWGRE